MPKSSWLATSGVTSAIISTPNRSAPSRCSSLGETTKTTPSGNTQLARPQKARADSRLGGRKAALASAGRERERGMTVVERSCSKAIATDRPPQRATAAASGIAFMS